MKVFLDTNVLVDYLNKREPFFADAAQVIDICGKNDICGIVSSLSVINAAYIMRKAYTKDSLLLKIKDSKSLPSIGKASKMPSPPARPILRMPCNTSPPYRQEPTSSSPGMPTGSKSSTCL